ncbi:MAG: hypothetical protein ACREQM_14355 [Candidatus Dormibacteraceae bacterium]
MRAAAFAFQGLVRIAVPAELVLGLIFWSGNLGFLVPLHEGLGLLLVLALWGLAVTAAIARITPAVVVLALTYGLAVPILGELQASLLPGSGHWIVETVHLLLGLGLLALAEWLGFLIRRRRPTPPGRSRGDARA